jgi:hypothetical protein
MRLRLFEDKKPKLDRIPEAIQDKFLTLVEDLKAKGPFNLSGRTTANWAGTNTIAISAIPGLPAGGMKREL